MSSHKHAPWRKSVLIPCWIIQLLCLLLLVGSCVILLAVVNNDYFYDDDGVYVVKKGAVNSVAAALLVIGVICLGLTFAEIIMLGRHKLSPKTFVIMNTIKSTVQVVMFIISIVSVVTQRSGGGVGSLSLIFQAALLLSFLGPLIYGGVIYHRARKGLGTPYQGVSHNNDIPIDTTYPSLYQPTNYGVPQTYPGPYKPANSVDGTTMRGDLEHGGVLQHDYRQERGVPESEPLAGQQASGRL